MSFDRGLSIGLFVFSSYALYLAITMPQTAIRQTVGPEVFPIGLTLCLMAASVGLFVHTSRTKEVKTRSSELPEGVERMDFKTQLMVLAGLPVYIFALEPLGYILATSALCIYEAMVFEAKYWLRNVLSGLAFSLGVYAIFVNLLDVMLPKGLLGW